MKNLSKTPTAVFNLVQDELVLIDGVVFITGFINLLDFTRIFFTEGTKHTDNYGGEISRVPPTRHIRSTHPDSTYRAAMTRELMCFLLSSREYNVS